MTLECLKIFGCLSLVIFPCTRRLPIGFLAKVLCTYIFVVCATGLEHRKLLDFLVLVIIDAVYES